MIIMDRAAWFGLLLGAGIGVVCGLWQAWDMRERAAPGLRRTGSAMVRLIFLMAALLAAYKLAGADKLWLVGGVAVTYTAVFVWKFRQALAKKK